MGNYQAMKDQMEKDKKALEIASKNLVNLIKALLILKILLIILRKHQ